MKIYVDTNVFMDFIIDRKESLVFEKSLQCLHTIVISDLVIKELEFNSVDASSLIAWLQFAEKLVLVDITDTEIQLARNINTHWNDALHIAAAKTANADLIVTNNLKDFLGLYKTTSHDDI